MARRLVVVIILSLLFAESVYGSGNRLIAQSSSSTGLGGACVAQVTGSDVVYWNPANMTDVAVGQAFELDLHYIHVPSQTYEDHRSDSLSGQSSSLSSFYPTFFYISEVHADFRFGLSFTTPFGLSREWDDPYPATFAEEYSLQVFELNPVVSYKINDMLSLGMGLRGVYGQAEVKSDGQSGSGIRFSREMDGDDLQIGYNVALMFKPYNRVRVGVTYRSRIIFDLEGDADLYTSANVPGTSNTYNGSGSVEYSLPAVLAVGFAYSFDTVVFELVWDRTYWSSYDELDFEYGTSVANPYLKSAFDVPIAKGWHDTDAFHFGITWVGLESWIFRAGFTLDETPIPESTLSFELPGSDQINYSLGMQYAFTSQLDIALDYLYVDKDDRDIQNSIIDGSFSGSEAHVLTLGFLYTF